MKDNDEKTQAMIEKYSTMSLSGLLDDLKYFAVIKDKYMERFEMDRHQDACENIRAIEMEIIQRVGSNY